jgi:ribosome-associated protein
LSGSKAGPLRLCTVSGVTRSPPSSLLVRESEVDITAVRAQGAGGQNVNKVSSAIHLRFDIAASSLPDDVKARLRALRDRRITEDGVLIIKAQSHRTQDMNRLDAFARLHALVDSVAEAPTVRRATRPTRASRQRRLDTKARRSETKAGRAKPLDG